MVQKNKVVGPSKLIVRSYNVGQGECTLLSFVYSSFRRHILLNFGSVRLPVGAEPDHMATIASEIATHCDGQLDAIISTHAQADRINGFAGVSQTGSSGSIIKSLKPKIVIQPWSNRDITLSRKLAERNFRLKKAHQTRRRMNLVAMGMNHQLKALSNLEASTVDALRESCANNIIDSQAVRNLNNMGVAAARSGVSWHGSRFVHAGSASGLGYMLPGVKVHVLGPATAEQKKKLIDNEHHEEESYWKMHASAGRKEVQNELLFVNFPREGTDSVPAYARNFIYRLQKIRGVELTQMARAMESAMNNESIILVVEVGAKSLLLSGDAEEDGWAYPLNQRKFRDILGRVNVFKLPSPRSTSNIPEDLWALFANRGKPGKYNRLGTLGSRPVNREPDLLMDRIRRQSDFMAMEYSGRRFVEVSLDLTELKG